MPEDVGKEAEERQIKHGVYKVGDKYYCAQCNTGLTFGRPCPECLTNFDWEKIRTEIYH